MAWPFAHESFTKLLKPVTSHLRQLGHLSVSHINDSYLQGDDYSDCAKNVLATIKLFDSLGFTKIELYSEKLLKILNISIMIFFQK